MGAAEQRNKSQAQAEYMRKRGISRTSGACPWGCGSMVKNGGEALIQHLGQCQGGIGRKRSRMAGRR